MDQSRGPLSWKNFLGTSVVPQSDRPTPPTKAKVEVFITELTANQDWSDLLLVEQTSAKALNDKIY